MVGYLESDEATLLGTLQSNETLSWPQQDRDVIDLVSRLNTYGWIETRDAKQVPAVTKAGADALAAHDSDTGRYHPNDAVYIEETKVAANKIALQALFELLVRKGLLSQQDVSDLTKAALDKARASRVEPRPEPSRRYRYLRTAILALVKGWVAESI